MTSRTDWRPAPAERAVLDSVPKYAPAHNSDSEASPRYQLAAAIRRLNAQIARLTPEQQCELQSDWLASWDELSRQREAAEGEQAELDAVAA
jgi:hypothetical protein